MSFCKIFGTTILSCLKIPLDTKIAKYKNVVDDSVMSFWNFHDELVTKILQKDTLKKIHE